MPQIQGVKGEAVLRYAEPLRTQEMRHHSAFPKGKKQGDISNEQKFTSGELSQESYIVNFFASLMEII
jgi:hypothetical protein